MKTTSPIARLFARSPFQPIQKHMSLVAECAALVVPLFEALRDDDHERLIATKDEIFSLERQADDVKNEIRSHLPKGLFMPVDRRDLIDLLGTQDAIADAAQDVAGLLATGKLKMPPGLDDMLLTFVRRNVDAARQCRAVIGELDELLELGFRGQRAELDFDMIEELAKIESDTDQLGMALRQALFDHDSEMGVLAVVFWYETIKKLGDIADHAEDVGDRLRLLIAR